jgi:membrane-bound lytic murein transglycosylase D
MRSLLVAALLLVAPRAVVAASPATAPVAPKEVQAPVEPPLPDGDAEGDDDTAEDADMDAVQADDALGIQDDVNAGKQELEGLLKAESQIIDKKDTSPRHFNRLGPANPLRAHAADANHAGGDSYDAAVPAPQGDAGGLVAELNGLDIAALKAEYDIPIEINEDVIQYVRFFQGPGRQWYQRWLARAHRWVPIMRPILAEEGVPLDLVYLAMIESGFSPFAYSWARASGFWQFISETGKRYGLRNDFWTDERRDPIQSTRAAAKYLRFLRKDVGDWYLAWASYNAGEGKIRKAIAKYHTTNFWELARAGKYLKKETKHYVPKLIAAAIIAKHPERFGFSDTEEEGPFAYDEVEVPDATDLQVVAKATGAPVEALQQMNPSLRRWCTPPAREGKGYRIKIPVGTKDNYLAEFSRLEPSERLTFRYRRVNKGDNIRSLAKEFAADPDAILKMNGVANAKSLKAGLDLIIPVSTAVAEKHPDRAIAWNEPRPPRHGRHGRAVRGGGAAVARAAPAPSGPRVAHESPTGLKYVVRSGDTLWSIARHFRVDVEDVKEWNNLSDRGHHSLQVGRSLRLSPPRKAETASRGKGRG